MRMEMSFFITEVSACELVPRSRAADSGWVP